MEKSVNPQLIDISISIVSHAQGELVAQLLEDLDEHCASLRFELILTLNTHESLLFSLDHFSYPIKLIQNAVPLGFGANHNQAFKQAIGQYFCVLNPDIRLVNDPFGPLLVCLQQSSVGVAAPLIVNTDGTVEDSARTFPSPWKILRKVFTKKITPDYVIASISIYPDWVGGMFMLFSKGTFRSLGGFDERYFLYYEDVDICARLRLLGFDIVLCPLCRAVHNAQRSSHRSLKYLRWHLTSMTRFFLSPVYWRLRFCTV